MTKSKKIGEEQGIDISKQRGFYEMQKGKVPIGNIVHAMGTHGALKEFIKNGVQGAMENIGEGMELSVYDPSVIHLVSKSPIKGIQ